SNSRILGGPAAATCGSRKFILLMKNADARNEAALTTKTASRPSNAPTAPPSAAPSRRLIDQVVDDKVLAMTRSSRVVMLGITELRAGSKKAAIMVSSSRSG